MSYLHRCPYPVIFTALRISACPIHSAMSHILYYPQRQEYLPVLSTSICPLSGPIRSAKNIFTSFPQCLISIFCLISSDRNIFMSYPQCYILYPVLSAALGISASSIQTAMFPILFYSHPYRIYASPIHSAYVPYPVLSTTLRISASSIQIAMFPILYYPQR